MRHLRHFHTPAQRMALGGVMTALSLVVQLLGGALGIGTYAAPLLGGLCTLLVRHCADCRTALLHWLATALLSLLLCSDKELALLYLLLLGWYPLVRPALGRLPRLLCLACKLLLFQLAVVLLCVALLWLVLDGDLIALGCGGLWLNLAALLLGNVTFLLYDNLLCRLQGRLK